MYELCHLFGLLKEFTEYAGCTKLCHLFGLLKEFTEYAGYTKLCQPDGPGIPLLRLQKPA